MATEGRATTEETLPVRPPPLPPDRDAHTKANGALAIRARAEITCALQPQTSSTAVGKGTRKRRYGGLIRSPSTPLEPPDRDTRKVAEGKLTTVEGGSSEHGIPKEIRADPVIQNLDQVSNLMGQAQFEKGRKWDFLVPYAAGQAGQVVIINMKD